ncbi:MAG: hypothetical protein IJ194_00040 [Bacilli bacterium]|nr:hypothetical protein [Bacilli bacterium]
MQLILVMECNSIAKTDYMYIKAFLDHFYPDRTVKLSPIFLGGKAKYDKVEKKIEEQKKKYHAGHNQKEKTNVCFFLDTDFGKDGDRLNSIIEKFCKEKQYYLVWFHRDVEEVFLQRQVSSEEKVKCSKAFLRKPSFNEKDLKKRVKIDFTNPPFGISNIKKVMDEIYGKLEKQE